MTRMEHRIESRFGEQLARYANLVATYGLNVQPGQLVNVSSEPYHREFLAALVTEMYRRGAGFVHVDLVDPILQRCRFEHSNAKSLGTLPNFYAAKFGELVDKGAANLKLLGPEFPEYLDGLPPEAVNTARKAGYQAAKRFYDEGIDKSKVQWCVIAAATPGWGARLFPNISAREAEMILWDHIFRICRVDRADYLSLWANHNSVLKNRARKLSALGIVTLHFSGPGTDLNVGLSERAFFKGGADSTDRGVVFEPNIPTEECFTTPDWRTVSGHVTATRPFLVNGTLIRGLRLEFKEGELVTFTCDEGGATFEAYTNSDVGARRLGEVALVGVDSPIFSSQVVFEEILFDENAACHIALGSAYRGCLYGGENFSDREAAEVGCNSSSVHTDIMISSESVGVRATLRDGRVVSLLECGEWMNDLSHDACVRA
jgi:aminopeptidase